MTLYLVVSLSVEPQLESVTPTTPPNARIADNAITLREIKDKNFANMARSDKDNRNQQFYLQYLGGGQYYIISARNGEYLTAPKTNKSSEVEFAEKQSGVNQRWYIEMKGN